MGDHEERFLRGSRRRVENRDMPQPFDHVIVKLGEERDTLAVALRRLIAKAKGVYVMSETPDQEQASEHLDIAVRLAEEVCRALAARDGNAEAHASATKEPIA